jgi:hypothetical protein
MFRLQLAGYSGGKIIASALILGAISWVLLSVGGDPGGALTFVYGGRVLKRPQARVVMRSFLVAPTIATDPCTTHRCRPPGTAPVHTDLSFPCGKHPIPQPGYAHGLRR